MNLISFHSLDMSPLGELRTVSSLLALCTKLI